jgi:cell division protein FtsZ
MGIKLQLPKLTDLRPRITVIGIGGAGGNAVNNMIASGLSGVEFVVANTDAQALAASSCEHRLQLGVNLTEGLGAGSKPEIGEAAAEEAIEEIRSQISGSHMVFVAAGMGGGTGTGAAAVFARIAKELGILTVAIVTKPFQFEGSRRQRIADAGIAELRKYVDTLIVIPNQNLFRIANERTTFAEAFVLADQVLYSGIACIVDLIVKEGLINLDFADVRTVLAGMGTAVMGTGEASGDRRAVVAAEEAITNPLLDELSLRGAKGLLVSSIGGRDLTLYEVDEAASRVRQEVDPEANIIVGATFDDSMQERVRVSIVASGMAGQGVAGQSGPAQGSGQVPPRTSGAGSSAFQGNPGAEPPPRRNAEDFAAVLSRALGHHEPLQPRRPAPSSATKWQAVDGVTIEEGLGPLGPGAMPPPLPIAQAGPGSAQPAGFAPAQPQDVRRGQRRIPGIEDFPEVAQRDYRAKSGEHGRQAGSTPSGQQPSHRKPGLLERLTGRGRRDEANHLGPEVYPQGAHDDGAAPVARPTEPQKLGSADDLGHGRADVRKSVENDQYFDRRRG